jgi:hypothetical protein
MFTNPLRDFYVKAVVHAKQKRMSDLNFLEAELIMIGEDLNDLRDNVGSEQVQFFESKIDELKQVVKDKKKQL